MISAGACVITGTELGAGIIVNTGATIDHDCKIGHCAQIAPGAHLGGNVIVGEYALIGIGEDRAYLTELAARQGVAERVHLLGHVPMDELPRWYNACDLFVMPNREIDGDTEGFGMVYVEAAACGKAAIAGTAGGTGSAVVDGVTGLRVDGEDGGQLLEAIAELLKDERRREEMGARGLERARSELAWERVAEKTRQLKM